MRCLVQRVKEASVSVSGNVIGAIEKRYLILLGVSQTDTEEVADKMLKKVLDARLFEDENGKTNLSIRDVSGALLVVSQFTLYAVEEIVPALLMQEPRTMPMPYMSIFVKRLKSRECLLPMGSSVRICRLL